MTTLIKILLVGLSLGLAAGAKLILKLKADNPVEEFAEELIEIATGHDVDLSPGVKSV